MEQLPNGITLNIPKGAFPLSTDSMALAHFARLPKKARVLDLGAGPGTLGLLLCAKDSGCTVSGVELDETAHRAALENIEANGLAGRMESICADAAQVPGLFAAGSFSVCISNPPYFSAGPASRTLPAARREDTLTPQSLMRSAAWALKTGGDLFLVHRPERMAQLMALGAQHGLECKRLCLLRHREDGPIALALLALRKGAKPGLHIDEWALHRSDGSPTELYHSIYHIEKHD